MKQNSQSLRKVAILVSSLESTWAEQLLRNFPKDVAEQIVRIADSLEEIDEEEQRQIVAEFRRNLAEEITSTDYEQEMSSVNGVELDASLMSRIENSEEDTYQNIRQSIPQNQSRRIGDVIHNVDGETIAQLIVGEHPQTIALILSRLGDYQAAELLSRLPTDLQAEVLSRMADLDTTDDQVIEVVETQLAEWITDQLQQKQRMTDGANLVQRILEKSPPQQRQAVMTKLSRSRPNLTNNLEVEDEPVRTTIQVQPNQTQRSPQQEPEFSRSIPRIPKAIASVVPSENPMAELELLSDQALLAAMNQTSQSVLMLALAGASENLLKRIMRGFPRRQANKFRQQLRVITPVKLSDMISAQQELLERAQAVSHTG